MTDKMGWEPPGCCCYLCEWIEFHFQKKRKLSNSYSPFLTCNLDTILNIKNVFFFKLDSLFEITDISGYLRASVNINFQYDNSYLSFPVNKRWRFRDINSYRHAIIYPVKRLYYSGMSCQVIFSVEYLMKRNNPFLLGQLGFSEQKKKEKNRYQKV